MTRESSFKRRVRARMAKTGEAYSTARAHLDTQPGAAGPGLLHVTNGDSVTGTLREAGVPGAILTWADVLHDGPVPAVGPAELRRRRARHLAARGWGDAKNVERLFAERERQLAANAGGDFVLWFEADLYDQLLLLQLIDAFRRHRVEPARVSLVSVGEYRGIAHFGGLGELTAQQLAPLAEQGQPLTEEATALAAVAWDAFRSSDPNGLPAIVRARSPELRFLGEAFARLLQEYPSRTDGLSLTQRRILLTVATTDGITAGRVFHALIEVERRPFLGDTLCWDCIEDLAESEVPLLEIGHQELPFPKRTLRLTDAGREVLAGRQDHVRRSGIDRWIGGVHLVGRTPPWRYDERLEALVTV
jgi:hypothetical protein